MSFDLMYMGSVLFLDLFYNDDLFIFGVVFIGGL